MVQVPANDAEGACVEPIEANSHRAFGLVQL